MPTRSCKKCGATVVRPTTSYAVQIPTATVNNTMARVQFRYTVTIEINGTPRYFHTAEVIDLNYSLIAVLLQTYPKCLSFETESDRVKFFAVYQELR